MKKITYILLILFFPIFVNANETFDKANEAYQAKRFGEAIIQYEKLITEGNVSAEIYYNLGNSYFRQQDIGKSILNYERALNISSDDKEILDNLEVSREQIKVRINETSGFFLYRWWNNIRAIASSNVWAWMTILFLWAGIGGFIIWLMGKERDLKKRGFVAGFLILLIGILPLLFSIQTSKLEKKNQIAIILEDEVIVKSAPDERSKDVLKIYEGTKIEILDQIDTWYKVQMINGDQGWLLKGVFDRI